MATRKQIDQTLAELEVVKNQLLNDTLPQIKQTKAELDQYREELLVGSEGNPAVKERINELQGKIVNLSNQAQEQVAAIQRLHDQVFQGGEQESSLKKQIDDFLNNAKQLFTDVNEKKEDLDTFYVKVFGKEDESGEVKGGLEQELEKYIKKHDTLFEKIESLLPGATAAGLAKVFEDKVKEYKKAEKRWAVGFLVTAIVLVIYFGVRAFFNPASDTFTSATLNLFHKSPFIAFAIWLLIFIGNRRAESKKLEESYKHKETMARAYVGYKEQIVELGDGGDQRLLERHMENLLEAVQENSGDFLSEEGDRHPFWDRFRKSRTANTSERGKGTEK